MGQAALRYTRDFEDVVAWLAQQMAKTPIAGLLRIAWDTVGRSSSVSSPSTSTRSAWTVSSRSASMNPYRRHHRYLTSVVDHRSGAIVWCSPGRNAETLKEFFDLLGERKHSIRAVSIDMSGGYEKAIREAIPQAEVAFDPFHVVRLAQRAVDQVRRNEWNAHERSHTPKGRWIKGTRWSLLKAPAKQKPEQLELLAEVQHANRSLYRAFLLKEELRLLYQLERPARAGAPRRVAGLGIQIKARAVRQARAHHPPAPPRHPRRDPPRPHQRAPGGPEQPHSPDQTPQLRVPLGRTTDRTRLPLLFRHHDRATAMRFTTEWCEAPFLWRA